MAALISSLGYAANIPVATGGDLQRALTNAQPGDTIVLQPGATFVGNFTLPQKNGDAPITIRSGGADAVLDGARLTPTAAAALAKIRSPNNLPALQTAPGAHHWSIVLVEFQANAGGAGDLIDLGDGSTAQSSLQMVPHDLLVDRCYIHGDPTVGQKRCVGLNSASTTIQNSYIADCKAIGQDAQAIAGWNGPGPFTIANNYLEGSSENVLFGGADPAIPALVPSNILLLGNTLSKPEAWRSQQWQVKNLFELKNARHVMVSGNTFQYNWQAAQTGFAILFTVRNQDGHCPWCEVSDVTFDRNVVQHSAAGVQILGTDDNYPSQQTHAIRITNNIFADIDGQHWGGNGYFLQLSAGPRDVTIDHNTIIQDHASGLIQIDGPPVLQFAFTNNLGRQNAYGIIGSNHAPGNDSIRTYLPASEVGYNVIADGDVARYPPLNQFPTSAQFMAQFVGYATGDYRLIPGSSWRGAGSDHHDLGAAASEAGRDPDAPGPRLPMSGEPAFRFRRNAADQ